MRAALNPAPSPERPAQMPCPNGWFAIAFSHELKPGMVLRKRLGDEDVVAYRTLGGQLRVVRPYCPHLGAHLGIGGTVDGENLVCPFHHFAFSPTGECVATGYGTPPPKANLQPREYRELNGVILVWQHDRNAPPTWEVPPVSTDGYSQPVVRTYDIDSYPQEFLENLVDFGHFTELHDYRSVGLASPAEFSGHYCRISTEMVRPFPILGPTTTRLDTHCYGLGYVVGHFAIPRLHAKTILLVNLVPAGPGKLRVCFEVRFQLPQLKTVSAPRLREALQTGIGHAIPQLLRPLAFWFDKELNDDVPIWHNKIYVDRPRLAKGDGPIIRYRRWAAQFYTRPSAETDLPHPTEHEAATGSPAAETPLPGNDHSTDGPRTHEGRGTSTAPRRNIS